MHTTPAFFNKSECAWLPSKRHAARHYLHVYRSSNLHGFTCGVLMISVCLWKWTGLLVVGFEKFSDFVRYMSLEVWLPQVGTSKAEMMQYFGEIEKLPAFGSAWPIAVVPLVGGVAITSIRLMLDNDFGTPLNALNKVRILPPIHHHKSSFRSDC
eukprot:606931-Prorocentrum_minimum.AAC.2